MAAELFRYDGNEGPFAELARQARARPEMLKVFSQAVAPAIHDQLGRINPAIFKPGAAQPPVGVLDGHRRYHLALQGMNVISATVSVTFQAKLAMKDVRIFFDDPANILYGITALKFGAKTVDLNFGGAPSSISGATTAAGVLSAAQSRVQVLDFNQFSGGIPIGDVELNDEFVMTLLTGWTAGTPFLGINCNTSTAGGWKNLGLADDCSCPTT